MNACQKCGMPGGAWITHACGVSNTASAMTVDQWQAAWEKAVKVVVAARRFVDAEKDSNAALIEDAHLGLLAALTDYEAAQLSAERPAAYQSGMELITAERQRQIDAEGWTPDHDDDHVGEELAKAAACYAMPCEAFIGQMDQVLTHIEPAWPWDKAWDKRDLDVRCCVPDVRQAVYITRLGVREARIRELAKAGALVAAEIDRLRRLP